jgi:hypothetical protein
MVARELQANTDQALAEHSGLFSSTDLAALPGPGIRTWGTQNLAQAVKWL